MEGGDAGLSRFHYKKVPHLEMFTKSKKCTWLVQMRGGVGSTSAAVEVRRRTGVVLQQRAGCLKRATSDLPVKFCHRKS